MINVSGSELAIASNYLICSWGPKFSQSFTLKGHFASCLDLTLKPEFLHMWLENHLHDGHGGMW